PGGLVLRGEQVRRHAAVGLPPQRRWGLRLRRIPRAPDGGRGVRDPVSLAIVAPDTREGHARLLAALHAALPRVGVLDPGVFVCDLAGTEQLLGAPVVLARRAVAR